MRYFNLKTDQNFFPAAIRPDQPEKFTPLHQTSQLELYTYTVK